MPFKFICHLFQGLNHLLWKAEYTSNFDPAAPIRRPFKIHSLHEPRMSSASFIGFYPSSQRTSSKLPMNVPMSTRLCSREFHSRRPLKVSLGLSKSIRDVQQTSNGNPHVSAVRYMRAPLGTSITDRRVSFNLVRQSNAPMGRTKVHYGRPLNAQCSLGVINFT